MQGTQDNPLPVCFKLSLNRLKRLILKSDRFLKQQVPALETKEKDNQRLLLQK